MLLGLAILIALGLLAKTAGVFENEVIEIRDPAPSAVAQPEKAPAVKGDTAADATGEEDAGGLAFGLEEVAEEPERGARKKRARKRDRSSDAQEPRAKAASGASPPDADQPREEAPKAKPPETNTPEPSRMGRPAAPEKKAPPSRSRPAFGAVDEVAPKKKPRKATPTFGAVDELAPETNKLSFVSRQTLAQNTRKLRAWEGRTIVVKKKSGQLLRGKLVRVLNTVIFVNVGGTSRKINLADVRWAKTL